MPATMDELDAIRNGDFSKASGDWVSLTVVML